MDYPDRLTSIKLYSENITVSNLANLMILKHQFPAAIVAKSIFFLHVGIIIIGLIT